MAPINVNNDFGGIVNLLTSFFNSILFINMKKQFLILFFCSFTLFSPVTSQSATSNSLNFPFVHDSVMLFDQCVMLGKNGDFERAKSFCLQSIGVDPTNALAFFVLGYIEEEQGNLEDALVAYEKSAQLDEEKAEVYYNIGNVYSKMEDNRSALDSYTIAVERDPEHLNAWINLFTVSYYEEEYKDAVKYFDKAVSLGYEPPEGFEEAVEEYR